MDLFEAVEARYSYRGRFRPAPVPADHLKRILAAGAAAPSGMNGQSTSFVGVTDPELIAAVAGILGGNPAVATAAALIAVIMDPEATADRGVSFGVEDYAAAVENMLLAMTALGYAGVWIDGALRRERRTGRISELLAIPGGLELRVVLPVGIPEAPGPRKEKRPLSERAWLNRWGEPL